MWLPLNAEGSSSTQIIIWVGLVVISGIGIYWFISHFNNAQATFEVINSDLFVLSTKINEHCDYNYYYYKYNPITEKGNISIDKNEICIKTSLLKKCVSVMCGPSHKADANLENITYILVKKDGNFQIFFQ